MIEKRGGHTKVSDVKTYKLGMFKCMLCDAEFNLISGKVNSCPDCKADESSVICVSDDEVKNKAK
jgi:Zn finger protein HypA/HybF involved in hydrogenase expression